MVDLSLITIPTPAAYDSAHPHQQRENLAYVWLQILAQAKADGDPDPLGILAQRPNIRVDLDDLSIRTFGDAALVESP